MKNLPWEISLINHFYLYFHHSKKNCLVCSCLVLLFSDNLKMYLMYLYLMMHSLWSDLVQLKDTSVSKKPKIKLSLV